MPPPDMLEQHVFGEEIVADEVSEGEFNVSPPKGLFSFTYIFHLC